MNHVLIASSDGAYLFPSGDAPKYLKGFGVISGMCFFGVAVYITAHVVVHRFAKRSNGSRVNEV